MEPRTSSSRHSIALTQPLLADLGPRKRAQLRMPSADLMSGLPSDFAQMSREDCIQWKKKKLADMNQSAQEFFEREQKVSDAYELMRRWTLSDQIKIGNYTQICQFSS